MLLGFGYLYVCYVLFHFSSKKQRIIDFKKKPVGQNFGILFFHFCLKQDRSGPQINKLTLSSLKYFHQNLFAISFISPSFPRVFFLTGSLLYHHHSQEYSFNWNITSSPYLEMLLINIIKLLFLFFLIDRTVQCCFL